MAVSTRSLLGIGVEAIPWIGLAVVSVFLPTSSLPNAVPQANIVLPILILSAGTLLIAGRCRWTPFSETSAAPLPRDEVEKGVSDSESENSFRTPSAASLPPEERRDSLTGLADHKALLNTLSDCLGESDRDAAEAPSAPALLTVRILEYRDVTESFGLQAAEELLTAVATRIADLSPPTATTAHTAEDTFAILLPATEEETAREVGELLLKSFDTPFDIAGRQVPIQASVGLALRPSPHSTFVSAEKMLQASYSAMHQVQRQGGDGLNVYRGGDRNGTRWLQRRERLREGIQQDELVLHYQPIVHLVSGDMIGAEALVRWKHPERGLLSPAAFMPLAEDTGLVEEVDRWVFTKVLKHANQWTTNPDLPLDWLSVNVSPQSMESDFQDWCRKQLHEASLPEGSLHLEITERWAVRDEGSFQPLREEGIRLSIDDFGTGYSSLRYLRSLEADVLKIDREFVQDLGQHEKTTAIVQFLMNLSLRLDVEVIAEGIETAAQEEILRDLGCAMGQGHRFSRPVPADRLLDRASSIRADTPASDEAGKSRPA